MDLLFSSAIYGAIVFFLLIYYHLLCQTYLKRGHELPPQPGGARPILGHLLLMGGSRPPHFNLADLADQHGPLFTIWLGARRVVVVSSWKIAKELYTTNDAAISSRVPTRTLKHLSNDFAMFGFSPYGPYWREVRKIVNIELLSSRRVELLSHVRVSEISQSTRELYALWEENEKDELGRVLVDMKKWFCDLNLNIMLKMVSGKRFLGGGNDGEEMQHCREVIREFFRLAAKFVAADALPWLSWLDLGGHEKRSKEVAKELDRITSEWLEEHRRKEDSGEDKEQDFMDLLLSVIRGSDQFDGRFDADTVIKTTCQIIILGGSDTGYVMLTWALSLLLNNRHVLTKARQELDKHVGRDRRVTDSDLDNLQYIHAIVKETLRLYPAAALGGPREFAQDCIIGGYHIPKGTWLMVNLSKIQRDPEVWLDNPLEFDPERFLTTHKNVDVKGMDFELIPFGAGRRICAGVHLGLQMFHLSLANVLQAFEVWTVSDAAVDMTESDGMTNLKATSLDVLIAPRLSPSLY